MFTGLVGELFGIATTFFGCACHLFSDSTRLLRFTTAKFAYPLLDFAQEVVPCALNLIFVHLEFHSLELAVRRYAAQCARHLHQSVRRRTYLLQRVI